MMTVPAKKQKRTANVTIRQATRFFESYLPCFLELAMSTDYILTRAGENLSAFETRSI